MGLHLEEEGEWLSLVTVQMPSWLEVEEAAAVELEKESPRAEEVQKRVVVVEVQLGLMLKKSELVVVVVVEEERMESALRLTAAAAEVQRQLEEWPLTMAFVLLAKAAVSCLSVEEVVLILQVVSICVDC